MIPAAAREVPVRFSFRGQRNYVQGSDLYHAVIAAVSEVAPGAPIRDVRVTMHGFIRHHGRLLWARDDAPVTPPDAGLEFRCDAGSTPLAGWICETGDTIAEHTPFHEDEIVRRCVTVGSRATCERPAMFTPVETVIAMTKALHQRLHPHKDGKWIIVRLDLRRAFDDHDTHLAIDLERRLTDRLTRSRIESGSETLGFVYFSLLKP